MSNFTDNANRISFTCRPATNRRANSARDKRATINVVVEQRKHRPERTAEESAPHVDTW